MPAWAVDEIQTWVETMGQAIDVHQMFRPRYFFPSPFYGHAQHHYGNCHLPYAEHMQVPQVSTRTQIHMRLCTYAAVSVCVICMRPTVQILLMQRICHRSSAEVTQTCW